MADEINLAFLARLITEQRDEARADRAAMAHAVADLSVRLDRLDQRLDGIGWRIDGAHESSRTQFNRMGERLDGLAARLDAVAQRVTTLEGE